MSLTAVTDGNEATSVKLSEALSDQVSSSVLDKVQKIMLEEVDRRLKKQEDEIMKQVQQGKHPKPKEGRRGISSKAPSPKHALGSPSVKRGLPALSGQSGSQNPSNSNRPRGTLGINPKKKHISNLPRKHGHGPGSKRLPPVNSTPSDFQFANVPRVASLHVGGGEEDVKARIKRQKEVASKAHKFSPCRNLVFHPSNYDKYYKELRKLEEKITPSSGSSLLLPSSSTVNKKAFQNMKNLLNSKMLPGGSKPSVEGLQLSQILGYNNHRHLEYGSTNVIYLGKEGDANEEIIYPASTVCVIQNIQTGKQRFMQEQGGKISCIAVHPNGQTVATGAAGDGGEVIIFDVLPSSETNENQGNQQNDESSKASNGGFNLKEFQDFYESDESVNDSSANQASDCLVIQGTKCIASVPNNPETTSSQNIHIKYKIKGPANTRGAVAIDFSPDGKLMAIIGNEERPMISIYELSDYSYPKLIVHSVASTSEVFQLKFNPYQYTGIPDALPIAGQAYTYNESCYTFVTIGRKHVRFWSLHRKSTQNVKGYSESTQGRHSDSHDNNHSTSDISTTKVKLDREFLMSNNLGDKDTSTSNQLIKINTADKMRKEHKNTAMEDDDYVWVMEGGNALIGKRGELQEFTSITFVDDSPTLKVRGIGGDLEETKDENGRLLKENSKGRTFIGTSKGDIYVFIQSRITIDSGDDKEENQEENYETNEEQYNESDSDTEDDNIDGLTSTSNSKPSKLEQLGVFAGQLEDDEEDLTRNWWESSDGENYLRSRWEGRGILISSIPHDIETGCNYNLAPSRKAKLLDTLLKLKSNPSSKILQDQRTKLVYNGPIAHNGAITSLLYNRQLGHIISAGKDGIKVWNVLPSTCEDFLLAVGPASKATRNGTCDLSLINEKGAGAKAMIDKNQSKKMSSETQIEECDGTPNGYVTSSQIKYMPDNSIKYIFGTNRNEIVEWDGDLENSSIEINPVVYAHEKSLSNVATNPTRGEFATGGKDGVVMFWQISDSEDDSNSNTTYKFLYRIKVRMTVNSLCYNPDGNSLLVAGERGSLMVLDRQDNGIWKKVGEKTLTNSNGDKRSHNETLSEINVISFSPNQKYLAVGIGPLIQILDIHKRYKKVAICKGHSANVLQVDWSLDGDYIQSNDANHELLFWQITYAPSQNSNKDGKSYERPTIKQVKVPSTVRDLKWSTWTCTLGWPTMGMWNEGNINTAVSTKTESTNLNPSKIEGLREKEEIIEINSLQRSHNGAFTVAAKENGSVYISNFPSVQEGNDCVKTSALHYAHVLDIAWLHNDKYVITVGGRDSSIFIWKNLNRLESQKRIENSADEEEKSISNSLDVDNSTNKEGPNTQESKNLKEAEEYETRSQTKQQVAPPVDLNSEEPEKSLVQSEDKKEKYFGEQKENNSPTATTQDDTLKVSSPSTEETKNESTLEQEKESFITEETESESNVVQEQSSLTAEKAENESTVQQEQEQEQETKNESIIEEEQESLVNDDAQEDQ